MVTIEVVPSDPRGEGAAAGCAMDAAAVRDGIEALRQGELLRDTLGTIERPTLDGLVTARLEAEPDDAALPELREVHPERVEWLRGFADGAGCTLTEAAVYDFLTYRAYTTWQHRIFQLQPEPAHCSGVLLVGPDGVLAGQNIDTAPAPKPSDYRHRRPIAYRTPRQRRAAAETLVVRKPRTGYIANCGVTNEKGVAFIGGGSCGVWLDEPLEDTWPIVEFPYLRYADSAKTLADLFRRYVLYLWGRSSSILADTTGDAYVIEQSYRRTGIRAKADHAIWSTEGYFHTPEMHAYLRGKRLEYLEKTGKHLGAGDLQYAADCAVRFTHLGELCHEPWGHGLEHMRRILTNHDTFPRALCRHAGPDTDPYDITVTQKSTIFDLTHNRTLVRDWQPWQRFPCEAGEVVREFGLRVEAG